MALLAAPLSPRSLALVGAVAAGFRQSGGDWPVWQYVDLRLAEQDIDGDEAYIGLPMWEHRYRPVWSNGSGAVPRPDEMIALTVHGIHHTGHPVMADLGRAFVAALRIAAGKRLELEPDPKTVLDVRIDGADVTVQANMRAGTPLSAAQLGSLLQHEPATWAGIDWAGESWSWNVSKARLSPFADTKDLAEYLGLLERVVGVRDQPARQVVLPPMALPEALDHLDVTWRLATQRPSLLRLSHATVVASLGQTANSREEFEARCSALVDLIKQFNVEAPGKPKQHKLDALEGTLREYDGLEMGEAENGIATLRLILDVRNGQQHRASDAKAVQSQMELGLRTWDGDWQASWDTLRSAAVGAFDALRRSLRSLTD